MKLKHRLGLFVFGIFTSLYGLTRWQKYGVFPYLNRKLQPMYPAGVIMLGVVLAALAFLPSGRWISELMSGKQRRKSRALDIRNPYQH